MGSAVGYYFNVTKNISERRSVLSTVYLLFASWISLFFIIIFAIIKSSISFDPILWRVSRKILKRFHILDLVHYMFVSALPLMSSQAIIRLLHKPIKYMSAELFCLAINGIF